MARRKWSWTKLQLERAENVIEVITELGKRQSKAALVLMSGFDQELLQTSKRIAQGYDLRVIDTLTKPMNISDITELLENLKNNL